MPALWFWSLPCRDSSLLFSVAVPLEGLHEVLAVYLGVSLWAWEVHFHLLFAWACISLQCRRMWHAHFEWQSLSEYGPHRKIILQWHLCSVLIMLPVALTLFYAVAFYHNLHSEYYAFSWTKGCCKGHIFSDLLVSYCRVYVLDYWVLNHFTYAKSVRLCSLNCPHTRLAYQHNVPNLAAYSWQHQYYRHSPCGFVMNCLVVVSDFKRPHNFPDVTFFAQKLLA